MLVNRIKLNLLRRLKKLEQMYIDIGKMVEEELQTLENKIDKFETKLYRYEDKIMMLECKLNEKNKATLNEMHEKLTNNNNENTVHIQTLKDDIDIKISEIDSQLKVKDTEMIRLESIVKEKNDALQSKMENMKGSDINENGPTIVALKKELSNVHNKLNKSEEILNVLNAKSMETDNKAPNFPNYESKCDYCSDRFNTKTEMEIHIESSHVMINFKCDKCDEVFISKWRLNVHLKSHTNEKKPRNCHYFNSGKNCPFERLGCKFHHIVSSDCKFGDKCTYKMCQFKHSSTED